MNNVTHEDLVDMLFREMQSANNLIGTLAVSYTHLDVYKRQPFLSSGGSCSCGISAASAAGSSPQPSGSALVP